MDLKTVKILESLKNKKAGVFYDSANLYRKYPEKLSFSGYMGYKENMAWELRLCQHLYINKIRNEVELKQNKPQVFTLGQR